MAKKLSAIASSITPFDECGRLDEAAFRKHLQRLASAGLSVYVGGPGTGETFALSEEERERIVAIAVEELKGRVSVRTMSFEPRVPQEIVEFLRRAEPHKPDAVVVFSLDLGHGAKPTRAQIERYYSIVLESTSLPIVLSSHESVGYFPPVDLLEEMARRFPHLIGLSYGGVDMTYLAALIERLGDRLEIHCAGPTNGLAVLGMGGNGFMGFEGSVCPELPASVITAYREGDMPAVAMRFRKLMALHALIQRFGGGMMTGVKPLLNAFGLSGGSLRLPRLPVSAAELKEFVREVQKLDLPGMPPPLAEFQ
jgi:4-hydroxy-tetrahydrodipicolinate synthase